MTSRRLPRNIEGFRILGEYMSYDNGEPYIDIAWDSNTHSGWYRIDLESDDDYVKRWREDYFERKAKHESK
jgi:hypothetical protein